MLILFTFSLTSLLLLSSSVLVWPVLCLTLFLSFLSYYNSLFNSSVTFIQSFSVMDGLSLFIVFLLFFIMYVAYLSSYTFGSFKLISLVFVALTFFCYQVFTTSHLFYLYFFYEASLIPILYIIIKWGSYPERSVRAIIILVYTLIFGAPVLVLIILLYSNIGSWFLSVYSSGSYSFIFTLFIFLCFSVKLPIYGLHFWLPIAHVEAPTFGSVILARLLLKLGGVGLLRLRDVIRHLSLANITLAYFMIFILYSSFVCCYQSDFKRLIAYSSVAHMIVIPFLIMSNNIMSVQALVLIMLLHGLSSTLLFMSVGALYTIFSSRQLVLIRGLLLISPLFSFLLIITFLFTLSAPPLPSYVAEVFFILSRFCLRPYMLYVVLFFAFLGLVYNLNWLIRTLFSTASSMVYTQSTVSYGVFLPIASTLLAIFPLVILFSFL